ncbi:carbohydrate esterase family 12 protein [Diplodia corticola]|uniref:Carbohydrate esterase family 12 protein n=1 Tax=Diplodia corticola TaxID=236234 RepID=A0A1J9QMY9_9PEZI|nr:carbohydrate esterase family 12 protein [Diplodia corticola]OJD30254.1 carbohydrate esterase family 12 protein [Diplodia corticola]
MLFLPAAFLLLSSASALPQPSVKRADTKPAAFFLAGDSTTAVQSDIGGGWGTGFLETTLQNGATGANYGHNGATTVSFRADGDWDTVLQAVRDAVDEYTPYVTIQFGHNDQKTDKNITIDHYKANLAQFVQDVRDAGGKPILVTPLSRRQYAPPANTTITRNLAAHSAATLAVASASSALSIDLNAASVAYLDAIGLDAAYTYNLVAGDRTHLNAAGSVVFGNMVSWLMGKEIGEEEGLEEWTVPGGSYVEAFEAGVYIAA